MTIELLTLIFIGLIGGTLAGLIGIGGGIIYILALEIYLTKTGVLATELHQFIIANSMFAIFFASISSSYRLYKLKEFYTKTVLLVATGGTIGSLLLLHFFVNTPYYSLHHFNILVLGILSYMLFRVIRKVSKKEDNIPLKEVSKRGFLLGGLGGGIIAALSGLGGGVIMIPVFNTYLKLDIKTSRSISLGVISITSFLMTINNLFQTPLTQLTNSFQLGYLIPEVTFPIIIGVLIGGQMGVIISKKMSGRTISIIYGVFLLGYITKKVVEFL